MKIRSIHKLNNRIRNYLFVFLCIFVASSLLSTGLFFWSVFNEVDDKVETWQSYFTDRISFLEKLINSRSSFDYGLESILKVAPDGEIINSRPFPTEEQSIRNYSIFPLIQDLAPGQVRIIKTPGVPKCELNKIFLVKRNDHSFSIAEVPYEELLPVAPKSPELFISNFSGDCIYHTKDTHALRKDKISGITFSGFHIFATAKSYTDKYGGFTITLAKNISTEFYIGSLLLSLSLTCLALLIKRSAFLTWDLAKNEEDFIRIGKLMARVSAKPEKQMSNLSAIEYTAESIRDVNWNDEVEAMSFEENRDYIVATSFLGLIRLKRTLLHECP